MDEDWLKIQKALENPKYKWRTVEGVAKETGLETVTVVSSLSNHNDLVIQSSIPSNTGADLFTTRDHYREKSTIFSRVMSSITNKVE
ncbi:MAG: hypothetical protein N0E59_10735 [Candidatus Thiodiazotropha taylori]|nr:hypothetical protein [Candidatus Thiodiazotropha taylori]MCG8096746.1 hypothetical protein [Candidatus Thiodiazotropha endolucinida]MCG8028670.1 hypothetical protein [Candidatus Thiodiazotropha taylori]MCG8105540.1 hypothetical protein [Candidatus Thiodiazotropha taylori]MCG8111225.1 hypothetical protein [Candidatus Thiodiazotropha taylori]